MKAVLICPGERPAVSALAQSAPLALVPILGKTLLEYWLDHLVDRGLRQVYLLASDRPELIRAWLGDGVRWELKVELVADDRELTTAEARAKYSSNEASDPCVKQGDVTVMDFLPGAPERPLFRSYADWFMAVTRRMPQAATAPDRIGVRELQSGVWAGLRSRISKGVQIDASFMMGADIYQTFEEMRDDLDRGLPRVGVGEGTVIKHAIIDKNTRIGSNARLLNEAGTSAADGPNGSYFIRDGSAGTDIFG